MCRVSSCVRHGSSSAEKWTSVSPCAEEVYVTAGLNRWKHTGGSSTVKMSRPTPDAVNLQAQITVPDDAWMIDLVFSSGVGEVRRCRWIL